MSDSTMNSTNDIQWLAKLAEQRFRPVVIHFDEQNLITAIHGDVNFYGYVEPPVGTKITDAFEFMFGAEFDDDLTLDFVETPNRRAIHAFVQQEAQHKVLSLVDATTERDQRQALQQKSNELALLNHKLNSLNIALEDKKQEAEHLSGLQSQFLASMSHEFRTPLASILTYANYLSRAESKVSLSDGLGSIERAAQYLLNLVENLIGHAQFSLEGIELDNRPANVHTIVQELQLLFSAIAAGKGLSFSATCESSVPENLVLDAMRLRQICINLLGNGCKYTEHGGVELTCSYNDHSLKLEVSDTGIGMSKDIQDVVFNAFERGGLTDNRGAGLGLHITQRLVELMCGEIIINSRLGEGTRISVQLPVQQSILAASKSTTTEPVPIQNDHKVLVVEDDSDVYDILEIYLDEANFDVYHADSGVAALEMMEHIQPDSVISDLNVPDLDGVELTKRLRAQNYSGAIIILTASDLRRDKERAMSAGCDKYLVKPVSPDALIDHLQQGATNYEQR